MTDFQHKVDNFLAYCKERRDDPKFKETLDALNYGPVDSDEELAFLATSLLSMNHWNFLAKDAAYDLEVFHHLPELNQLWIETPVAMDLSPLAGHPSLSSLIVIGPTERIPFISPRIETIELHNAPGVDLSELAKYENLYELVLENCPIDNFDFLAELGNLKILKIEGGELNDLSQLPVHRGLEQLSLQHHRLGSLTGIEHYRQLTSLSVPSNLIPDLAPLKALKQLKHLSLGYNPTADLSVLDKLDQLKTLEIRGLNVDKLDVVRKLKNLKALYCDDNQIRSLKPLAELKKLETLSIRNNDVHNLAPLHKLKRLKKLYASNNNIAAFSELPANLHTLHLDNNAFVDLESLKTLDKIPQDELNISHNFIQDLSPLKAFPGLKSLDIGHNRVHSLEPLRKLKKLSDLNARANRIRDISPLASHKKLEYLNVNNNRISNLSILSSLDKLSKDYAHFDNNIVGHGIRKSAQTAPAKLGGKSTKKWRQKQPYKLWSPHNIDFEYITKKDD